MKFLLALLITTFSITAQSAVLVGLVDIQKIITTIKEGKSVQKQLEKAFTDKKVILKKDEDKIKKAQEDYKKQSMVLAEIFLLLIITFPEVGWSSPPNK